MISFFGEPFVGLQQIKISKLVSHIVCQRGCIDIGALSQGAGLKPRHFARRFIDHMGMRPKLLARVVRFQAALQSKALFGKTWTDVAHNFGYFDQMLIADNHNANEKILDPDQMHLIHEFEQLADRSPKELLTQLETVFVDQIRRIRCNPVHAATLSDAVSLFKAKRPGRAEDSRQ